MSVVPTNRKNVVPRAFTIAELIKKEGFETGISTLGENQDPFTLSEKEFIKIYDPDPSKKVMKEIPNHPIPLIRIVSPHIATFHLKTCNEKEWGMYCLDPEYYEKIKQLAKKIDAQFSKQYGISRINLICEDLSNSSTTITSK